MAFGQIGIEGDGSAGGRERLFVPFGISLLARIAVPAPAEVERSAKLRPGWSEARIDFQGLDQEGPRLVQMLPVARADDRLCPDIHFIGARIGAAVGRDHLQAEMLQDSAACGGFDALGIARWRCEPAGPERRGIARIDQPDIEAQHTL